MTSVFANYEPEIVNAEEHIVGVCRTLEVSQSGSVLLSTHGDYFLLHPTPHLFRRAN